VTATGCFHIAMPGSRATADHRPRILLAATDAAVSQGSAPGSHEHRAHRHRTFAVARQANDPKGCTERRVRVREGRSTRHTGSVQRPRMPRSAASVRPSGGEHFLVQDGPGGRVCLGGDLDGVVDVFGCRAGSASRRPRRRSSGCSPVGARNWPPAASSSRPRGTTRPGGWRPTSACGSTRSACSTWTTCAGSWPGSAS
jgi:hypothetical protein